MLFRVYIQCVRHRTTRATPRKFTLDSVQQPGTYVQQAHGSKSVKGQSRASSKKRVADESIIEPKSSFSRSSNRSKCSTSRPMTKSDICPFSISIFCHSKDLNWYLSCATTKLKVDLQHHGHIRVCPAHLSSRINHLPKNIDQFIVNHLHERIAPSQIVALVKQTYNTTLTEGDLYKYRNKMLYGMLDATVNTPYGTPVDKLIYHFTNKKDVSFMYVMHDMNSGFVTYRKNKTENSSKETLVDESFISVYKNSVESWRNELKLEDSKEMLVAFAWCHDEELRYFKMFPEFLSCDVTFGVTKERRNLVLIAGVDANNKVFTCFHCFMPSKQARAYHWVLRIAARHLLTDTLLSLNQCIACDQEYAMYQPLRQMMEHCDCLRRSHNRLDKYHLLQKEWLDNVECKVNSKEAKSILHIFKNKVSDLFDYVETVQELDVAFKHYHKYYHGVKKELNSMPACESIEKVVLSIQNNLQFVAHCYFIDVCTFDFLGDSIVESANSGLKGGSLSVSTAMTINTSAGTQLKIGENQIMKKHK